MTGPVSARLDEIEAALADAHSGWCGAHPGHQERGAPYAGLACHCRLKDIVTALAPLLATVREQADALDAVRTLADRKEREAAEFFGVRGRIRPVNIPSDELRALLPAEHTTDEEQR